MERRERSPSAIDGGHRLDDGVGGVPRVCRRDAVIAVAAIARMLFAKPGDRLAAALRRLADVEQRVELRRSTRLTCLGRIAFVDHAATLDDIAHPVTHPGSGRIAIAAGAACSLIVGFDGAGHVEMGDEAHVGLVDAHAEGDRSQP